jgi:hypothetical protein
MIYVRWLAITHFVFGVIYSIASLSVTPENAGPLVLLVVLPLAATLTAFYVWTLNSLNFTLRDLVQRKQTVKASMYKKLWWCILTSIIVIFAFFFVNSWTFAGQSDEDFVPNHWSTRWFILDGWLNLIYFADVAFVAYIWRPTANNRRFAMSDEVSKPAISPNRIELQANTTCQTDRPRRRRLRPRLPRLARPRRRSRGRRRRRRNTQTTRLRLPVRHRRFTGQSPRRFTTSGSDSAEAFDAAAGESGWRDDV